MSRKDIRLIEAGFPCHQVGAETQRERDTGQSPPVNRLHVWWRRPLTPSRAAIVASLDPATIDPETFVRQLGIERKQALVRDEPWTLTGSLLEKIEVRDGREVLPVDASVMRALAAEQARRKENRELITRLKLGSHELRNDQVLKRWEDESQPLPERLVKEGDLLEVHRVMGDPAHVSDRIAFAKLPEVKRIVGGELKWDAEDLYGYGRAFANDHAPEPSNLVMLDPTAGGGSIPFEALRLGHKVIANELNPVATTILHATLDYPARFGLSLADSIKRWGQKLLEHVECEMEGLAPFSPISKDELAALRAHLAKCPELISKYSTEYDFTGLLYARQVTCPHCGGEAPLLNTLWLSKEADDPWGVRILTDGAKKKKVRFETYRVIKGRGPNGENPDTSTVSDGVGVCVHCKQAIDGDEIKAQARGESAVGKWQDRLYAVVAVRLQPKLDRRGQPQR